MINDNTRNVVIRVTPTSTDSRDTGSPKPGCPGPSPT